MTDTMKYRQLFTPEEDAFIIANRSMTNAQVAEALGRPLGSIGTRWMKLHIQAKPDTMKSCKPYTPEEDEYILANTTMSAQRIADKLGRTGKSVEHRRGELRKIHDLPEKQSGANTQGVTKKNPAFVDIPLPKRKVIEAGGWVVEWNLDADKMRVIGAVTAY